MVLLHMKHTSPTWLAEAKAADGVEQTLRDLTAIHNARARLAALADAAATLADHGVAKTPEQQGLDDDTPLLEDYDVAAGVVKSRPPATSTPQNYRKDPTERRTGDAPPDDIAKVLHKTVDDAKALLDERQVTMKVPCQLRALDEARNNIKGAVMIAYPMGLPDYDEVRQMLEGRHEGAAAAELLEVDKAALWCFSKELQLERPLSDYVGKNDKSKVVAKLQRKGAGAPQREPVVSEEEQKAMIAFYHKKQREAEALAAEEDDSYLNSRWADPKGLKHAFTGIGDVQWRGGRS